MDGQGSGMCILRLIVCLFFFPRDEVCVRFRSKHYSVCHGRCLKSRKREKMAVSMRAAEAIWCRTFFLSLSLSAFQPPFQTKTKLAPQNRVLASSQELYARFGLEIQIFQLCKDIKSLPLASMSKPRVIAFEPCRPKSSNDGRFPTKTS